MRLEDLGGTLDWTGWQGSCFPETPELEGALELHRASAHKYQTELRAVRSFAVLAPLRRFELNSTLAGLPASGKVAQRPEGDEERRERRSSSFEAKGVRLALFAASGC